MGFLMGFVRVCFAVSKTVIHEVLIRLTEILEKIPKL
jgi:bifunctional pyridoxal-dependent enzyme with beta-cystathionase and maltose regulon repressor activities